MSIESLKKSNSLALLLGMFAGDGCLPIKYNGEGYRNYQICFYNTNYTYVKLFHLLFKEIFGLDGKIFKRERKNKKLLWRFEIYSKKIYTMLNKDFEITNGKKALTVFIPKFILKGNQMIKKYFFLGLLITDGGVRADKTIIFHSASKKLIENLNVLIKDVWNISKPIKKYYQNNRYLSYQLNLNKLESKMILLELPGSRNLVSR